MIKNARNRFTFRLPAELFNKIELEANKKEISKNALMLQILWDWINQRRGRGMKIKMRFRLLDMVDLKEILKELDKIKKETPNIYFDIEVSIGC